MIANAPRNGGRRRPWNAFLLAAAVLLPLVAGCSVNPATGRQSFTGCLSEADERQIGAENHPVILQEFGGAYDDPQLQAYVNSIGQKLASTSDRPNVKYTFTVLDSPVVNAFAVPGGYIYVTRGLMALANNEAELAGVLSHEIGHIAAKHTNERYCRALVAQLGIFGLGAATGSSAVAEAANLGAALYLQSYSRDQEFEADLLGVRYLGNGVLRSERHVDLPRQHAREHKARCPAGRYAGRRRPVRHFPDPSAHGRPRAARGRAGDGRATRCAGIGDA